MGPSARVCSKFQRDRTGESPIKRNVARKKHVKEAPEADCKTSVPKSLQINSRTSADGAEIYQGFASTRVLIGIMARIVDREQNRGKQVKIHYTNTAKTDENSRSRSRSIPFTVSLYQNYFYYHIYEQLCVPNSI